MIYRAAGADSALLRFWRRALDLGPDMSKNGALKDIVMHWISVGAVAYLGILLGVFALQRSLLYPGARETATLGPLPPAFEEIVTEPTPGIALRHWYRPPAEADGPLVVAFHGNAGHIGDRVEKLSALTDAGFGLFLVGYRGYGGNPGKPSEEGLSADARSVLDRLAADGIASGRLVFYGESLGTAVAVKMASERPVAGVVLEAPPSSIAAVAQAHYWYLPARWLVLDQWNSLDRIDDISAPARCRNGLLVPTVP